MSWPALTWAKETVVGSSSEKAVLIALAYRHNEDLDLAYPSIASICEFTELNRKTVIAALTKLEEKGLIADSGQRVGRTKSVIGYGLSLHVKTERSQKGDSLKKGGSSPNFSGKQSQKRDTERKGKTTSESKDSSVGSPPDETELPLGLPPIAVTETPADVGEFIANQWKSTVEHFGAVPIRGGKLTEANAEKARALGRALAVADDQSAIEVWQELFARIGESDFLQGKVAGRDGRAPFRLTLGFLLEKRNFVKVLEGRFGGQSTGERKRGSTSEAIGRVLDGLRAGRQQRSGAGNQSGADNRGQDRIADGRAGRPAGAGAAR